MIAAQTLSDRSLARVAFAAFQDRHPLAAIAGVRQAFEESGRAAPVDCAALATDGHVSDSDLIRGGKMPEVRLWA
jgi:hypothetical protein